MFMVVLSVTLAISNFVLVDLTGQRVVCHIKDSCLTEEFKWSWRQIYLYLLMLGLFFGNAYYFWKFLTEAYRLRYITNLEQRINRLRRRITPGQVGPPTNTGA
jgi:hypothetical protein